MLDAALAPAHHVALQRREHRLAVALEHERPRLVEPVHGRLAESPAERPPHKPLQLDAPRGPDVQVVREERVQPIGMHPRALELGGAEHAPVANREGRRGPPTTPADAVAAFET